MLQEFSALFSGNGIIPMIILILGLLLCLFEIFIPSFGIFGITGFSFIAIGIVVRMILGGSVTQLVIMLSGSVILLLLVILILLILIKIGVIKNFSIIQTKTAIPTDFGKTEKQLLKLVGKIAFAKSVFKPSGKFVYKDKIYHGFSKNGFIEKNAKVKIVEIKENRIFVEKI